VARNSWSRANKDWGQSQAFSTSNRRWIAYLNSLSLNATLAAEEHAPCYCFSTIAANPSIWEVVNGTGISWNDTNSINSNWGGWFERTVRFKNGWIFLAGQLIIIWQCKSIWKKAAFDLGYTTHALLKNMGTYDAGDRAYCLDGEDLISIWIYCGWRVKYVQKKLLALKLPLLLIPHPNRKLVQRLGNPTHFTTHGSTVRNVGSSWNMEVGDNVCTKNVKDSNNSGQSFNGCKLVYQISHFGEV